MNTHELEKHFARMGVRIKTERPLSPHHIGWRWSEPTEFTMDVQRDRDGEHFVLTLSEESEKQRQIEVLQVKPAERHLLMLVKSPAERGHGFVKDRFLCGHDEREWFVAAVPGAVSTVSDAMESLKPDPVRVAQSREKLNGKQRNRRKNRAFRRQGEWFFIPVPDTQVDESTVLEDEPISRSGGKPHRVQFLSRLGGRRLYVCRHYPNGLLEKAYRDLIRTNRGAKNWGWQIRSENPRVYAKGQIRHSDHQTITLHGWHEVLMNTENQSRTMQNVAFID